MWKDVLFPGEITVGSAEKPRRYKFTAGDLHNAAEVGNAKLVEGWNIPLCWEHQDDAMPVQLSAGQRLAEACKETFGEARAFRVHNGRLQVLPNVESQADRERLAKIKYASPQLKWDWLDSTGKKWPGLTIQHIAATPIPKQRGQNAFNLSNGSIRIPNEEIIRLSEGDPVAEENDDDKKPKKKGGDDDAPPIEGEGAGFGELLAALREVGMNIPEEVKDIAGLIIAVKASGDAGPDGTDGLDDPNAMPANVGEGNPAPVGLSNAEKKSIERATTLTRTDLDRRVNSLLKSGRITPPIAAKLKNQSGSVKLSFTPDGDLQDNALTIRIEAYEALPKGTAWSRTGKRGVNLSDGDVREVDPPEHVGGVKSDKEALATWDATP